MNWKADKALEAKYKGKAVSVTPVWDVTSNCLQYNDISDEIHSLGVLIFEASIGDVFKGIYEPSIYEGSTLWDSSHCSVKIAKAIDNWVNIIHLSPPFFVKHPNFDLALVADGKHRLTVSHAMLDSKEIIPFQVTAKDVNWLKKAIPNATLVAKI